MRCNHGAIVNGAGFRFATMTSLAKASMEKCDQALGYILGNLG
jgi:hypothetical protein